MVAVIDATLDGRLKPILGGRGGLAETDALLSDRHADRSARTQVADRERRRLQPRRQDNEALSAADAFDDAVQRIVLADEVGDERSPRFEPIAAGGFRIGLGDGTVDAQTVVLAAGAWSRALAEGVGDNIPLDTERGYHIEFAMDRPLLQRPVSPVDLGFYATPMSGRLRIAGLVELGGLSAPLNPSRIAQLERGAREMFPSLGPMQS